MRKPSIRVKESSIEDSCRDYAHSLKWVSRKMNGLGFRSWPDRLFLPPQRPQIRRPKRFWVEFKRPGEDSTPDQARMQADLRLRGEDVFVLDNKQDFIKVIHARKMEA